MQKKILVLVAAFLFSLNVFADVCNDDYKVLDQTQIQTGTLEPGICFLSIDPFSESNLIFRSYIFSSDSSLLVFNSFGEGPDSTSTGAREFLFFPRKQTLDYVSGPSLLDIEMSGSHYALDTTKTQFGKIDGISFQEAAEVSRTNNGGIEIVSSNRPYLDLGFRMGAAPRGLASGKAVFHDGSAQTCELANSDIFDYSKDPANPIFKFANDPDLAAFLKVRCANLDVSSL